MLHIGKLKLNSKVILAPMAGITGLPYRLVSRSLGCAMAYLEMINARSLSYETKKTMIMLKTCAEDRPLGVQILGKEEKYLLRALDKLKDYDYDLLDFNCACPQKKITGRGTGAALLKTPEKICELLKILRKNCTKPLTVKLRLGWDSGQKAADIARYAEDAGIDAVCVHGRTKVQGYSGAVDYSALAKIKKAVSIPLIASGDMFTPALAAKMINETGADAVMAARGSLGNPWIFKAVNEYLDKGREPDLPSLAELISVMQDHLQQNVACFGESEGVKKFRKFFIWYTRGFGRTKDLRNSVSGLKTQKDMALHISIFEKKALDLRRTINYPAERSTSF